MNTKSEAEFYKNLNADDMQRHSRCLYHLMEVGIINAFTWERIDNSNSILPKYGKSDIYYRLIIYYK